VARQCRHGPDVDKNRALLQSKWPATSYFSPAYRVWAWVVSCVGLRPGPCKFEQVANVKQRHKCRTPSRGLDAASLGALRAAQSDIVAGFPIRSGPV
jgi:hypothetical protein